jgi:hypothetical protein
MRKQKIVAKDKLNILMMKIIIAQEEKVLSQQVDIQDSMLTLQV